MDPETQKMLRESLELARENNTLLRRMRSAQQRAHIFRIIYWVIILGVTFGAYYMIQPYINDVFGYYNTLTTFGKSSAEGNSSMPDLNQVQDLIKQLQNQ